MILGKVLSRNIFVFLWFIALILSGIYAFKNIQLETNILKLLPKYDSPITSQLINKASTKINDKIIFVVAGVQQEKTKQAFLSQVETLKSSGLFKQIDYQIDLTTYQNLYQNLIKFRFLMMAQVDQEAKERYPKDYFFDSALAELYGLNGFSENQLQQDPLFFFNHVIAQLSDFTRVELDIDDELLHKVKDNTHHYLAFLQLNNSSFSPKYQQKVVDILHQSKDSLTKNSLQQYSFGSVRYAFAAYQDAKGEISTVGLGSLIGIILLFLITFRSMIPLLLSTTALASGIIFGFAATLLVFKQVHLFALVFGSTIAGVAIDYCFHYLSESLLENERNKSVIKQILPGLLIGFTSSAMVYFGFILTGYEVLAQISLFSIMGLLAVLLNVVLIFPLVIRGQTKQQPQLLLGLSQIIFNNPLARLFNTLSKVVVVFAICLGLNWYFLNANDDVRALQSLSPSLKAEEQKIRDLLALKRDSHYVLIHSQSIDKLLQLEQKVLKEINLQLKDHHLLGVSDLLPPTTTQKHNLLFYKELYSSPQFSEYLKNTGLNTEIQTNVLSKITKESFINFNVLENKNIQKLLAQRWLGKIEDYYALAIPLENNISVSPTHNIIIVQQAKDASNLFAKFRHKSINIVAASALMLFLLLTFIRYTWQKALHIVLLPFTAGLLSLLLAQLLGLHISLFSVLSLLLILGMGLDYVVFLAEAKTKKLQKHVSFALLLSATTTILSFGLLSLSHVAVLKSFGFSVAVGIIIVLLISPAITQRK